MEPIMIEKLQALKMYRSSRRKHYNSTLAQFFITIILLGLLLSSPLRLPHFLSYLNFVSVFFPEIASLLLDHRCLFLVCNVIIVILASEIKLSKSSMEVNIYEEYVERSDRLHEVPSSCAGKEKGSQFVTSLGEEENNDKEHGLEKYEANGEEEACIRNVDELNKRVEDFIARVTKQRRLEERRFACNE